MGKNKALRVTAFLTLILYLSSTFHPSDLSAFFEVERQTPLLEQFRWHVPEKNGSLEALYLPPKPKPEVILYHLQDVHNSQEVQDNLHELLLRLKKENRLDLVLVEGASGSLNPGYFQFFEEGKANRQLWDKLYQDGLISGVETFLLENPEVPAYGLEAADSYEGNLSAYRRVLTQQRQSKKLLQDLEVQLLRHVDQDISPEAKHFLKAWRDTHQDSMGFQEYLKLLYDYSEKYLEFSWDDPALQKLWPNLIRIYHAQKIEESADAAHISRDYRALKESLGKDFPQEAQSLDLWLDMPRPAMSHSLMLARQFQTQGELLYQALKKNGRSFSDFPAFRDYLAALIFQNEVETEALFREVSSLEERIFQSLVEPSRHFEIFSLFRDFSILSKALTLELSREEAKRFRERKNAFSLKRFKHDLRLKQVAEEAILDPLVDQAIQFYDGAERREKSFMQSLDTVRTGKKLPAKHIALVAGGYHTEGIQKCLQDKEVPYLVIRPRLGSVHEVHETIYREMLMGQYREASALPHARVSLMDLPLLRRMIGPDALKSFSSSVISRTETVWGTDSSRWPLRRVSSNHLEAFRQLARAENREGAMSRSGLSKEMRNRLLPFFKRGEIGTGTLEFWGHKLQVGRNLFGKPVIENYSLPQKEKDALEIDPEMTRFTLRALEEFLASKSLQRKARKAELFQDEASLQAAALALRTLHLSELMEQNGWDLKPVRSALSGEKDLLLLQLMLKDPSRRILEGKARALKTFEEGKRISGDDASKKERRTLRRMMIAGALLLFAGVFLYQQFFYLPATENKKMIPFPAAAAQKEIPAKNLPEPVLEKGKTYHLKGSTKPIPPGKALDFHSPFDGDTSLRVQVPGRVKKWRVEPGSRVRKGEMVAELESPALNESIRKLAGENEDGRDGEIKNLKDQLKSAAGASKVKIQLDIEIKEIELLRFRELRDATTVIRAPYDFIVKKKLRTEVNVNDSLLEVYPSQILWLLVPLGKDTEERPVPGSLMYAHDRRMTLSVNGKKIEKILWKDRGVDAQTRQPFFIFRVLMPEPVEDPQAEISYDLTIAPEVPALERAQLPRIPVLAESFFRTGEREAVDIKAPRSGGRLSWKIAEGETVRSAQEAASSPFTALMESSRLRLAGVLKNIQTRLASLDPVSNQEEFNLLTNAAITAQRVLEQLKNEQENARAVIDEGIEGVAVDVLPSLEQGYPASLGNQAPVLFKVWLPEVHAGILPEGRIDTKTMERMFLVRKSLLEKGIPHGYPVVAELSGGQLMLGSVSGEKRNLTGTETLNLAGEGAVSLVFRDSSMTLNGDAVRVFLPDLKAMAPGEWDQWLEYFQKQEKQAAAHPGIPGRFIATDRTLAWEYAALKASASDTSRGRMEELRVILADGNPSQRIGDFQDFIRDHWQDRDPEVLKMILEAPHADLAEESLRLYRQAVIKNPSRFSEMLKIFDALWREKNFARAAQIYPYLKDILEIQPAERSQDVLENLYHASRSEEGVTETLLSLLKSSDPESRVSYRILRGPFFPSLQDLAEAYEKSLKGGETETAFRLAGEISRRVSLEKTEKAGLSGITLWTQAILTFRRGGKEELNQHLHEENRRADLDFWTYSPLQGRGPFYADPLYLTPAENFTPAEPVLNFNGFLNDYRALEDKAPENFYFDQLGDSRKSEWIRHSAGPQDLARMMRQPRYEKWFPVLQEELLQTEEGFFLLAQIYASQKISESPSFKEQLLKAAIAAASEWEERRGVLAHDQAGRSPAVLAVYQRALLKMYAEAPDGSEQKRASLKLFFSLFASPYELVPFVENEIDAHYFLRLEPYFQRIVPPGLDAASFRNAARDEMERKSAASLLRLESERYGYNSIAEIKPGSELAAFQQIQESVSLKRWIYEDSSFPALLEQQAAKIVNQAEAKALVRRVSDGIPYWTRQVYGGKRVHFSYFYYAMPILAVFSVLFSIVWIFKAAGKYLEQKRREKFRNQLKQKGGGLVLLADYFMRELSTFKQQVLNPGNTRVFQPSTSDHFAAMVKLLEAREWRPSDVSRYLQLLDALLRNPKTKYSPQWHKNISNADYSAYSYVYQLMTMAARLGVIRGVMQSAMLKSSEEGKGSREIREEALILGQNLHALAEYGRTAAAIHYSLVPVNNMKEHLYQLGSSNMVEKFVEAVVQWTYLYRQTWGYAQMKHLKIAAKGLHRANVLHSDLYPNVADILEQSKQTIRENIGAPLQENMFLGQTKTKKRRQIWLRFLFFAGLSSPFLYSIYLHVVEWAAGASGETFWLGLASRVVGLPLIIFGFHLYAVLSGWGSKFYDQSMAELDDMESLFGQMHLRDAEALKKNYGTTEDFRSMFAKSYLNRQRQVLENEFAPRQASSVDMIVVRDTFKEGLSESDKIAVLRIRWKGLVRPETPIVLVRAAHFRGGKKFEINGTGMFYLAAKKELAESLHELTAQYPHLKGKKTESLISVFIKDIDESDPRVLSSKFANLYGTAQTLRSMNRPGDIIDRASALNLSPAMEFGDQGGVYLQTSLKSREYVTRGTHILFGDDVAEGQLTQIFVGVSENSLDDFMDDLEDAERKAKRPVFHDSLDLENREVAQFPTMTNLVVVSYNSPREFSDYNRKIVNIHEEIQKLAGEVPAAELPYIKMDLSDLLVIWFRLATKAHKTANYLPAITQHLNQSAKGARTFYEDLLEYFEDYASEYRFRLNFMLPHPMQQFFRYLTERKIRKNESVTKTSRENALEWLEKYAPVEWHQLGEFQKEYSGMPVSGTPLNSRPLSKEAANAITGGIRHENRSVEADGKPVLFRFRKTKIELIPKAEEQDPYDDQMLRKIFSVSKGLQTWFRESAGDVESLPVEFYGKWIKAPQWVESGEGKSTGKNFERRYFFKVLFPDGTRKVVMVFASDKRTQFWNEAETEEYLYLRKALAQSKDESGNPVSVKEIINDAAGRPVFEDGKTKVVYFKKNGENQYQLRPEGEEKPVFTVSLHAPVRTGEAFAVEGSDQTFQFEWNHQMHRAGVALIPVVSVPQEEPLFEEAPRAPPAEENVSEVSAVVRGEEAIQRFLSEISGLKQAVTEGPEDDIEVEAGSSDDITWTRPDRLKEFKKWIVSKWGMTAGAALIAVIIFVIFWMKSAPAKPLPQAPAPAKNLPAKEERKEPVKKVEVPKNLAPAPLAKAPQRPQPLPPVPNPAPMPPPAQAVLNPPQPLLFPQIPLDPETQKALAEAPHLPEAPAAEPAVLEIPWTKEETAAIKNIMKLFGFSEKNKTEAALPYFENEIALILKRRRPYLLADAVQRKIFLQDLGTALQQDITLLSVKWQKSPALSFNDYWLPAEIQSLINVPQDPVSKTPQLKHRFTIPSLLALGEIRMASGRKATLESLLSELRLRYFQEMKNWDSALEDMPFILELAYHLRRGELTAGFADWARRQDFSGETGRSMLSTKYLQLTAPLDRLRLDLLSNHTLTPDQFLSELGFGNFDLFIRYLNFQIAQLNRPEPFLDLYAGAQAGPDSFSGFWTLTKYLKREYPFEEKRFDILNLTPEQYTYLLDNGDIQKMAKLEAEQIAVSLSEWAATMNSQMMRIIDPGNQLGIPDPGKMEVKTESNGNISTTVTVSKGDVTKIGRPTPAFLARIEELKRNLKGRPGGTMPAVIWRTGVDLALQDVHEQHKNIYNQIGAQGALDWFRKQIPVKLRLKDYSVQNPQEIELLSQLMVAQMAREGRDFKIERERILFMNAVSDFYNENGLTALIKLYTPDFGELLEPSWLGQLLSDEHINWPNERGRLSRFRKITQEHIQAFPESDRRILNSILRVLEKIETPAGQEDMLRRFEVEFAALENGALNIPDYGGAEFYLLSHFFSRQQQGIKWVWVRKPKEELRLSFIQLSRDYQLYLAQQVRTSLTGLLFQQQIFPRVHEGVEQGRETSDLVHSPQDRHYKLTAVEMIALQAEDLALLFKDVTAEAYQQLPHPGILESQAVSLVYPRNLRVLEQWTARVESWHLSPDDRRQVLQDLRKFMMNPQIRTELLKVYRHLSSTKSPDFEDFREFIFDEAVRYASSPSEYLKKTSALIELLQMQEPLRDKIREQALNFFAGMESSIYGGRMKKDKSSTEAERELVRLWSDDIRVKKEDFLNARARAWSVLAGNPEALSKVYALEPLFSDVVFGTPSILSPSDPGAVLRSREAFLSLKPILELTVSAEPDLSAELILEQFDANLKRVHAWLEHVRKNPDVKKQILDQTLQQLKQQPEHQALTPEELEARLKILPYQAVYQDVLSREVFRFNPAPEAPQIAAPVDFGIAALGTAEQEAFESLTQAYQRMPLKRTDRTTPAFTPEEMQLLDAVKFESQAKSSFGKTSVILKLPEEGKSPQAFDSLLIYSSAQSKWMRKSINAQGIFGKNAPVKAKRGALSTSGFEWLQANGQPILELRADQSMLLVGQEIFHLGMESMRPEGMQAVKAYVKLPEQDAGGPVFLGLVLRGEHYKGIVIVTGNYDPQKGLSLEIKRNFELIDTKQQDSLPLLDRGVSMGYRLAPGTGVHAKRPDEDVKALPVFPHGPALQWIDNNRPFQQFDLLHGDQEGLRIKILKVASKPRTALGILHKWDSRGQEEIMRVLHFMDPSGQGPHFSAITVETLRFETRSLPFQSIYRAYEQHLNGFQLDDIDSISVGARTLYTLHQKLLQQIEKRIHGMSDEELRHFTAFDDLVYALYFQPMRDFGFSRLESSERQNLVDLFAEESLIRLEVAKILWNEKRANRGLEALAADPKQDALKKVSGFYESMGSRYRYSFHPEDLPDNIRLYYGHHRRVLERIRSYVAELDEYTIGTFDLNYFVHEVYVSSMPALIGNMEPVENRRMLVMLMLRESASILSEVHDTLALKRAEHREEKPAVKKQLRVPVSQEFGIAIIPARRVERTDLDALKGFIKFFPNKVLVVIAGGMGARELGQINQYAARHLEGRVFIAPAYRGSYTRTVEGLFRGQRQIFPLINEFMPKVNQAAQRARIAPTRMNLNALVKYSSAVFSTREVPENEESVYLGLLKTRLWNEPAAMAGVSGSASLQFSVLSTLSLATAGLEGLDERHLDRVFLSNLQEISQNANSSLYSAQIVPQKGFLEMLADTFKPHEALARSA